MLHSISIFPSFLSTVSCTSTSLTAHSTSILLYVNESTPKLRFAFQHLQGEGTCKIPSIVLNLNGYVRGNAGKREISYYQYGKKAVKSEEVNNLQPVHHFTG